MYYRFDLSDEQWERIASFFPDCYHGGQAGHPWKAHRPLVNGIQWHLHTGAPWPDTPRRYGKWQTIYDRFNRWRKDGTWAKILDALLLQLDKEGLIDRDLWCVDATVIRAHPAAAGAEKKSGPGGRVGRAGADATRGAARPCVGAFAGRLRHQGAPGVR
jgi:transposase